MDKVNGLFDCPAMGHRVSAYECETFFGRDIGCPADCEHRPDKEEIPPGPPLSKGGEVEESLSKGGEIEESLAKGGEVEVAESECMYIDGIFVRQGDPEKNEKPHALYDTTGQIVGRICSKCQNPKLFKKFARAKNGFMGHKPMCKDCHNAYLKTYNQNKNNPEKKPARPAIEPAAQPAELLEKTGPSNEEILAAIERGAYNAFIDTAAGVFERIAENIRKGAKT